MGQAQDDIAYTQFARGVARGSVQQQERPGLSRQRLQILPVDAFQVKGLKGRLLGGKTCSVVLGGTGLPVAILPFAVGKEGRSETSVPLNGPLYAMDINGVYSYAEN